MASGWPGGPASQPNARSGRGVGGDSWKCRGSDPEGLRFVEIFGYLDLALIEAAPQAVTLDRGDGKRSARRLRRRLLVRLDGAGFSHELLDHIAAGGGTRGRDWEFSVGWSCTDKEMDAIQTLPAGAWTAGIDQNGDLVPDTFVADLTGLLDLGRWHDKISDLRIIGRDEPLHPRYRKRATEREQ
jgi:hypothetical protein